VYMPSKYLCLDYWQDKENVDYWVAVFQLLLLGGLAIYIALRIVSGKRGLHLVPFAATAG
jgi:hypothetical protein